MRRIIQILLFVISYAPLYLILFIQNIQDKYMDNGAFIGIEQLLSNNRVSISLLALTILSILLYVILYKMVLKSSTEILKINGKRNNNDEQLSYLVTYVLPFVGLQFNTWQSIVASILLFCVIGIIYIRTNLILINPTLMFLGFSILEVDTDAEKHIFLIHQNNVTINIGKKYNCIHLTGKIYIQKP